MRPGLKPNGISEMLRRILGRFCVFWSLLVEFHDFFMNLRLKAHSGHVRLMRRVGFEVFSRVARVHHRHSCEVSRDLTEYIRGGRAGDRIEDSSGFQWISTELSPFLVISVTFARFDDFAFHS